MLGALSPAAALSGAGSLYVLGGCPNAFELQAAPVRGQHAKPVDSQSVVARKGAILVNVLHRPFDFN